MVSILASFNIVPAVDEKGEAKPVELDYTTGAIAYVYIITAFFLSVKMKARAADRCGDVL